MCNSPAGCEWITDNGYFVCCYCGRVGPQALDVRNVSYTHESGYLRVMYTRSNRFSSKVLGALNRKISCAIDPNLVNHLKKNNATQPEDVVEGIRTWVTSAKRKPYIFASTYGVAIGLPDYTMDPNDICRIVTIFDEIFFAHKRLRFKGPNFPFSELLHLICENFEMEATTEYVVRYAKRLRCDTRTQRYKEMFDECLTHVATKLDLQMFKCREQTLKRLRKTNQI